MSLTVSDLAKEFGKTNTQITWGITLVLMFRSVGSVTFGIAADRYGRKWPFIVNNLLFIALELVCQNILTGTLSRHGSLLGRIVGDDVMLLAVLQIPPPPIQA